MLYSTVASAAPDKVSGTAVESIRILGNRSISDKDITDVLPVRPHDAYDEKSLTATDEVVSSLYRSQGFLKVKVRAHVDTIDVSSVSFVISIEEGQAFTFGQTHVEGLETLPETVIANNITYKPGDMFKKRELFESQSMLYRSGFFSSVSVRSSTVSETTADVMIQVKQQPTRWLKAGVGWGSEERQRVSLTLTHNNLFHRAYKTEWFGTVSSIWQEYKVDFTNPYFYGTKTSLRSSLGWRREDREGYSFERVLGEAAFARTFKHNVSVTWTPYQIKITNTFDVDPDIATETPDVSDERSTLVTIGIDSANDFFFPTRGARNNLTLQHTGGVLSGDADYNKASIESRRYFPLGHTIVLALAARAGAIWPFNSTTVPIFDKFFIGGGNTVRGYKERGVGPQEPGGAPLGGDWMFGANAELRFPLVWKLAGAVFIDGGQVADDYKDVQIKTWRYGAGGGIRLHTPVGPIRLDYGQKINPASDDPDHWRLHFSLGETF